MRATFALLLCAPAIALADATPPPKRDPKPAAAAPIDPRVAARAHFQLGAVAYDEGRVDEAEREFRAAYRLAPEPAVMFNIVQCMRRQGKLTQARDELRALDREGKLPHADLAQRIAELEHEIAAPKPPAPSPAK